MAPGTALVELLARVRVHAVEMGDVLHLVLVGVVDARALLERAAVDAQVGEVPVLVRLDLEGHRAEGLVRVGVALDVVAALRVVAPDGGDVAGGGQVVADGVEQLLDAAVAQGGAAEDGVERVGDGGLAQGALDVGDGDLLLGQVLVRHPLDLLADGLDEVGAGLLDLVDAVRRDGADVVAGAEHVLLVDDGLAVDQVDDALEVGVGADGELDGDGVGAEALADVGDGAAEVAAEAVELVDEADAGHDVALGLVPDGLALGLHAADAAEDDDDAVQHAHAALHLDGEVDVAGGVDDVDVVLVAAGGVVAAVGRLPDAGGGGADDGDAALLLLGHPVGGGGALVDAAHAVQPAGVVEDAFGDGGLAGVDVGGDADVSELVQFGGGHGESASRRGARGCETGSRQAPLAGTGRAARCRV